MVSEPRLEIEIMADSSSSYPSLPLNTMVHMLTIKLTSSNYLLWRNQFVPLLTSQELFGYLDGSIVAPCAVITDSSGVTKPNPAHNSWLHTDQMLLSLLLSSLTEESMSEVLGLRHSQKAWQALEVSFSHRSKTRELQLKDELQLMQRGSQSVAEFSRIFKGLCDQLAAIGRPVDDTDKVHWYLRALGPDYKIFSTTMISQHPLPSFSEIVPKALSHEIFAKSVSHSPSNSVYYTQQTSRRSEPKRGKSRFSTTSTYSGSVKPPSNTAVYCQLCDKEGHLAKRYWNFLKLKKKQSANIAEAFSACTVQDFNNHEWFPDSGATSHITNNSENLDVSTVYTGNERVLIGNGQSLPISHKGSVSNIVPQSSLVLSNVLVVPDITKNLISISQLTKQLNCQVIFDSSGFVIQDLATRTVLGVGRCENGLYVLDQHHCALASILSSNKPRATVRLWHARLGHPHFRLVASLSRIGSISCSDKLTQTDYSYCDGCQLGKSHRLPFSPNDKHSDLPFDRLHCDLWGPSPISSVNGYRYYAVFIDDCTRFSWMFPLKHKSDFFDTFINFQNYITTQFSAKLKSFQCDGGTEFTNTKFRNHLQSHSIVQRLACPYTPSQNGIAERKHRHVTETGLTLMFHARLPISFWVEAFSTAVFLINRLPSPSLGGQTPYDLLFGKKPDYSMLRTFGCLCFPYLRDYSPHKLSPKSAPCVFLGYSTLHKGFRCFDR